MDTSNPTVSKSSCYNRISLSLLLDDPFSFPTSHVKVVVETTMMNLEKFDIGWKIIASRTSIGGM
jgi:hypothetical protein